jgi:hypothetical protein
MNDENKAIRPKPVPLPATIADWDAARKVKLDRTLNDHIEVLHRDLLVHPDDKVRSMYEAYLDAVYDEDAVEGSLSADNIEASRMIRDHAREVIGENDTVRDDYVASKKLATIVKALNVVLRRYGASRNQRAVTIDGHPVPNGNE